MPKILILKSYEHTKCCLTEVRLAADKHRSELGFLPSHVYNDYALQGKLWLAVDADKQNYMGHLLFSDSYPVIRIVQIYSDPDYRRKGISKKLIEELIEYGEGHQFTSLVARVACDLIIANRFWEALSFKVIRQTPGGRTTGRTINILAYQLKTPSLFANTDELQFSAVGLMNLPPSPDRPLMQSRTYVLDINVLLDILRKRPREVPARAIIRAGLEGIVQLRVTSEFISELERSHPGSGTDPLLDFALELPQLPNVPKKSLIPLVATLRSIIFPDRSPMSANATKDQSDLYHLATCIHHRAFAFITSDNAVLRKGESLKDEYGLSILSPAELHDSFSLSGGDYHPIRIQQKNIEISVYPYKETERNEVEIFLDSMGISRPEINEAWRPGTSSSPRSRICVRLGEQIIGVAAWDRAATHSTDVPLYLFQDEDKAVSDRIIDHLLESALRTIGPDRPRRVVLHITHSQALTADIALKRGFERLTSESDGGNIELFRKVSMSGIVLPSTWSKFSTYLTQLTGLTLPEKMPRYSDVTRVGLKLAVPHAANFVTNIFRLETIISPVMFLFPGRSGLIVPIRRVFAEGLIGSPEGQLSLLSSPEALLHIEKAYFRSKSSHAKFKASTPVVFYVSGANRGPKQAVGIGRVTYSGLHSATDANIQFERQGVLDERSLKQIADNNQLLHVFTFDNFQSFHKYISYRQLKSHGCVGNANLRTVQALSANDLIWICEEGFENVQKSSK